MIDGDEIDGAPFKVAEIGDEPGERRHDDAMD
jgi:hypothetical protein